MDDKHDQSVSPPLEGINLLYKIEENGGEGLNVTSVCHTSVSGGFFPLFSNKTISGYLSTLGYTG